MKKDQSGSHLHTQSIGNVNNNELFNQDIDTFIQLMNNSLSQWEENISMCYSNIKTALNKLEIEFPQIDINNFTDFLLIIEEYYSILQHSKMFIQKISDINLENDRLRNKIDKLHGRKVDLKSSNANLQEDAKFKDFQLKKLEDDFNLLTKEYLELSNKINGCNTMNKGSDDLIYEEVTSNRRLSAHNPINSAQELRMLNEEKSNLQKENAMFIKRVEFLESEIRNKYVSKVEVEKRICQIETEKNVFSSRLTISELNLEKFRKEILKYKIENDELKMELQRLEKNYDELKNIQSGPLHNFNSEIPNMETPLNILLEDSEVEHEIYEPNKRLMKLSLNTLQNINITSHNQEDVEKKIIDQSFKLLENVNEKESTPNDINNPFNISFASGRNSNGKIEENESIQLKITSNEIVNQMTENKFIEFQKKSTNTNEKTNQTIQSPVPMNLHDIIKPICTNRNFSIKRCNQNYTEDSYREFFFLTYQSIKLNSDSIEPFLILNAEKLYKLSGESCVPFHKYGKFIKEEIKKYSKKIKSKIAYNRSKIETV